MDWSNWGYLAIGLLLGVGGSRLFRWRLTDASEQQLIYYQQAKQEVETLSQQLGQTQLAYEMASQMSKFKGGFLARTSHELRSPLNSIIGTHQLILADLCDDPAEEREFIAQANSSALKLVKLLDDIIIVAKTEHGTARMQIQPLQLAGILQEVDELTHLQAKNSNIRLQILFPDPEIYILADPRRIKQVLVNLIDSAIAQLKEGSIDVSAHLSPAAKYAHIWIDLPGEAAVWSEPVDLLRSLFQSLKEINNTKLIPPTPDKIPDSQTPDPFKPNKNCYNLSSGMTLLINQTILELMQGRLEVVEIPGLSTEGRADESDLIRLQCSFPLAIPEMESD